MAQKYNEPTVQLGLRLPKSLLGKVEKFRKKIDSESSVPITRADALRILLEQGLDSTRKRR